MADRTEVPEVADVSLRESPDDLDVGFFMGEDNLSMKVMAEHPFYVEEWGRFSPIVDLPFSTTFSESTGEIVSTDVRSAKDSQALDVSGHIGGTEEQWFTVSMTMDLGDGSQCFVELMRPSSWIERQAVVVGEPTALELPELHLSGEALTTDVRLITNPQRLEIGTVTGTFTTSNVRVLNLWVDDLADPIGVTANHPFWSMDRGAWVAAEDLVRGERLRTSHGTATTTGISPRLRGETVHNLEVHGYHTYFVSDAKLLVHNVCIKISRKMAHTRIVKLLRRSGFGAPRATRSGLGKMYTHPDGTQIRIMPRPNRAPFPNEPPAKFQGPYYYRMRFGLDQPWGPHTSIPR